MEHTYTQKDLIRFIYKETSFEERYNIEAALRANYLLREQYNELLLANQFLPKVQFNPPKSLLQNILNYSKQTALEIHS